jgi:hypothetical protein
MWQLVANMAGLTRIVAIGARVRQACGAPKRTFRLIRRSWKTIMSIAVAMLGSGAKSQTLIHAHFESRSRHPRSSTAMKMRSRWGHQMRGGLLFHACHTGVAICHSTDRQ